MSEQQLPVRKYVRVWLKKRTNPSRVDGSRSVSYTLEWVEYGQRRFFSLGKHATATYARAERARKEKELNSVEGRQILEPVSWSDFRRKYLDAIYPGHDLPPKQRAEAARNWGKSLKSMLAERLAMENFQRIRMNAAKRDGVWCHEVTTADREHFVAERMKEVRSAESVDADLRNLRTIFNVMEEWKHRPQRSNPFGGRKKATVGTRRKRAKEAANVGEKKAAHYTRPQIIALLNRADKEVAEEPNNWERRRLRSLVYFEAFTGARIGEALHLEWDAEVGLEGGGKAKEIDFDLGVAFLNWKIEHELKTRGSEAPVGLPDALLEVLREWRQYRTCGWVFPNRDGKPWTGGGPGYKHLDQLKTLAKRAGIEHATWKMFRHSLNTHGKQWFGMTKEQMQMQLRHEDEETQRHYDHADLENLRAAVKDIDFRC